MRPLKPEVDSFDPQLPILSGWLLDAPPAQGYNAQVATVQCDSWLDDIMPIGLPPTFHSRLYQWPAVVGPIVLAGMPPDVAPTPVDLIVADPNIYPPVIAALAMPFDPAPDVQLPNSSMPARRIPLPEVYAMADKSVWTAQQTDPVIFPFPAGALAGKGSTRFVISGVTRDQSNNPLGGCTVMVFKVPAVWNPDALSNPVAGSAVSDVSGNYSVTVAGPGPYEVIAYLAGSTDVAGVTVNTITPVQT